jgi:hypothetical protein
MAAMALCAACGARTPLADADAGATADADVAAVADAPDAPGCIPAVPPVERCNGLDDDCDGLVDEGLPYEPIGPARALRTIEGDTHGVPQCSSCRWAWEPSLAPTATGFVVPFRIGIYGGREEPSLFSRATDADGAPLGEVRSEGAEVPLYLRRWDMPGPDGDTWIDANVRVGRDDRPGWVIVDRDGRTRVITQGATGQRSPSVTLNGAVIVGTTAGVNVRAEQSVIEGAQVRTTSRRVLVPDIAQGGLTSLGLAVAPRGDGAVLFVSRFFASPRTFRLWAQRLGGSGEPVGDATLVIAEGAPLRFFAATTNDGYLIFDPGNGSPATSRFVDAELRGAGEPVALDPGTTGGALGFDYLRMPDGAWLAHTGGALVRLDPRGAPSARWSGELAPEGRRGEVVTPDLNRRAGRTFITWQDIAPDATPNTVWVRELGCAPGR